MKTEARNILVNFIVTLFLHVDESLSLPSNINKDNALNPYNIEISLPFYVNEKTKSSYLEEREQALTKEVRRWSLGIVHYFVDVSSYDYLVSYQIRSAMNILESSTCIKFSPLLVKPEGSEKFIHITNQNKERDCNHEPLFKDTGEIILVLGYDCLSNVNIMHSLLHALGLKDAVTHPDRDKYIRVLWNNIQPAYRHLYNIQEGRSITVEYDPMSIMHFSDRDFTVNGQATIEPVVSGLVINPSETLSPLDKLRLRLIFGHVCNNREVHNILKTCRKTLSKTREIVDNEEEDDTETLKDIAKEPDVKDKEDKIQNAEVIKSETEADSEENGNLLKDKDKNNSEEKDIDKNDNETNKDANAGTKDEIEKSDDIEHSNEEDTGKTENNKY